MNDGKITVTVGKQPPPSGKITVTIGKEPLKGCRRASSYTQEMTNEEFLKRAEGKTIAEMFDETPAGIHGRSEKDRRAGPEDRRGRNSILARDRRVGSEDRRSGNSIMTGDRRKNSDGDLVLA